MSDIARTCRSVDSWPSDPICYPVNAHAASLPDIDGAAIRDLRVDCQKVCTHHVYNMRKIAGLLSVPVDREGSALSAGLQERADDREIRSLGSHARAKDIEITKGQGLYPVKPMEQSRV